MKSFKTRFFDGITIKPYQVEVTLNPEGLHIVSLDDAQVLNLMWRKQDLIVTLIPRENTPGQVSQKNTPDARLMIPDASVYNELEQHVPSLLVQPSHITHTWRNLGLFFVAILFSIGLFLWGFPKATPFIVSGVPKSLDEKVGAFLQRTLVESDRVCVDKEGLLALTVMLKRLQPNVPISVLVTSNSEVNAFSVGGKNIVLFRGLLDKSTNPDMIAGVLAHEIGHVHKRHVMVNLTRQLGIYVALFGLSGGQLNLATLLINTHHSRLQEEEADNYALGMLKKARISSQGFSDFFGIISDDSEDQMILKYLSSHPPSTLRKDKAQDLSLDQTTAALDAKNWHALKNLCRKTMPYEEYRAQVINKQSKSP